MSKNKKIPLTQRICERLDLPTGTLGDMCFIEAAGNRELTVSGCIGLLSYTDDCAILRLCDGTLTVIGEGLTLRSFAGGRVAVRGTLRCIKYGEEECDAT